MEAVYVGLGIVVAYLLGGLRVLREYERGVYFFLGRLWGAKGPGLIFQPPLFARMQKVSLRVVAMDIPPQDVITRDNISIKVNAVLYMKVRDAVRAVNEVENYLYATSQLAQTTLRSGLERAGHIIGAEPAAIQLRYLQTVTEIASENNSTTIFPIPLDLFRAFLEAAGTRVRAGTPALPEKTSGDALPAARSEQKAKV